MQKGNETQIWWDQRNAHRNVVKYGVLFEDAKTVFSDPYAKVFPDFIDVTAVLSREVIVGYATLQRLMVVSFESSCEEVKIISARKATRNEGEMTHQEEEDPLHTERSFDYRKAKPNRFARSSFARTGLKINI